MKKQCGIWFLLFCVQINVAQAQTPARLSETVNQFLATLSANELKQVKFSVDDSNRRKWTNLPVGLVPRPGIRYGNLTDQSRIAFHHVLNSMLTSQGYLKLTSIMQLDDILNNLYQDAYNRGEMKAADFKMIQDLKWDHGNYFIAIWGMPQEKDPWGMSFGGHHIALNFTVANGAMSVSPLFIGTDPSEIKKSRYAGWKVLSKEEDYGFMLINDLSPDQLNKAILHQEVPGDILTNPKSSQRIESFYGIPGTELTDAQKDMLRMIIGEYVHNFEHDIAHRIITQMEQTGLGKVYFAWIGSRAHNQPHYYIIHGPDFLIEYDNVGFQKDGNHIHAILREKGNVFGDDILRTHYLTSPHHRK